MLNTFRKLFATVLSVFLSLMNILGILPQQSEYYVETDIRYHNAVPGSADALLSLTANTDGIYSLYWGDEKGKKLTKSTDGEVFTYSHFAQIEVLLGEGEIDLPDFTAIPYGAHYILVCRDGTVVDRFAIEPHKLTQQEASVYSYGVISDLHFNRYDMEDGTDVAETTFGRSLQFFDTFDVSVVAMPGDISTDGEAEAFQAFDRISSEFDFPVYTCTGNHDLHDKFELSNWQAYMNKGVYGEEKAEGVLHVADNGLDFVYSGPETNGDVFIFLSQTSNNYGMLFNALLTNAQLNWLAEQFETYKDHRVYFFFHTFLNAPSGNPMMGAGNLVNDLGWFYPLFYTPGANDEIRLRNLLREYDNVVFFSGHSHWAYHMQSMNEHLNIADYGEGGATYVHVSSVSSPRTTDGFQILWSSNDPGMSEGYLAEVYEDHILLYGCDFVNSELLAYALYRIDI